MSKLKGLDFFQSSGRVFIHMKKIYTMILAMFLLSSNAETYISYDNYNKIINVNPIGFVFKMENDVDLPKMELDFNQINKDERPTVQYNLPIENVIIAPIIPEPSSKILFAIGGIIVIMNKLKI